MGLFREYGMEQVTTNDIAERAKIPIGSLYRYYPNKESIIDAIIDLYAEDVTSIFKEIGANPMLKYLSWEEVLTILIDGWANYSRLNGSFTFLFGIWANPSLYEQSYKSRTKFMTAFVSVLKKRYPKLKKQQALICFNFGVIAVKMAVNKDDQKVGGGDLMQEAVEVIAAYMDRTCGPQSRETEDMLLN